MDISEFVSPAMDPDYQGYTPIEIFMAQQQGMGSVDGSDSTSGVAERDMSTSRPTEHQ